MIALVCSRVLSRVRGYRRDPSLCCGTLSALVVLWNAFSVGEAHGESGGAGRSVAVDQANVKAAAFENFAAAFGALERGKAGVHPPLAFSRVEDLDTEVSRAGARGHGHQQTPMTKACLAHSSIL